MIINKDLTVIIPSKENDEKLELLIDNLILQVVKPIEIIIINANVNENNNKNILKEKCKNSKINLIYLNKVNSKPGESRNIGIKHSKTEFIMFMDVKTIPTRTYISNTIKLQRDLNNDGVFGATIYEAKSQFENLVRDSIYGCNPINTLPGTLIRKKIAVRVGSFIEWIRSGEDLEWISRLKLLKINVAKNNSNNYLIYTGLEKITLSKMIEKWNEFYKDSINLHTYDKYIKLILILFYPIIFIMAYNWNSFFANWEESSPLYIAHLTKYIIITPLLVYIFIRGIFIPLRKNVKYNKIFPLRWLLIALICLILDSIKLKCLLKKYEI